MSERMVELSRLAAEIMERAAAAPQPEPISAWECEDHVDDLRDPREWER